MRSIRNLSIVGAVMALSLLAAVPAFAQPPDPATEVTTLTTAMVGEAFPVVLAVFTGIAGLLVTVSGAWFIYNRIKGLARGRS